MNGFQIALLAAFIFILVVGVLVFSGILPGFRPSPGGAAGEINIWGSIPEVIIQPVLQQVNDSYQKDFTLVYTYYSPEELEAGFVNALADGAPPDLLFLPSRLLASEKNRLAIIPAASYPQRLFEDTFVNAASLFWSSEGPYALPLYLDPIVMYYNRDLLANAGIARVPANWTEFIDNIRPLTVSDERQNILQSAVALGQFNNIAHAKDLLTTLIFQAGNSIIAEKQGQLVSILNEQAGGPLPPSAAALTFYSQFADPSRTTYTWNSALPPARDFFVAGKSVFYLGYASEWGSLLRQNPHLNLDVALIPQRDDSNLKLTLAQLTGVAVVRGSSKLGAATQAAMILSGAEFSPKLARALNLPPARRDLLAPPADPQLAIFYRAAVSSRAWLDPAPQATEQIFRQMVEAVISGRLEPTAAVRAASIELDQVLAEANNQ